METVVLEGVTYMKASAVAKRFKYSSDYIGQLCRAKKVDARLVGRTWFVNPDSMVEHKKEKYSKTTTEKKSSPADTARNTKPELIKIISPLKNKTAKSTQFSPRIAGTDKSYSVKISYQDDRGSLLPVVAKKRQKAVSKIVRVEPAQAKKVSIALASKKPVNFEPEEMPDFALSGKLPVVEISAEEYDAGKSETAPIPVKVVSSEQSKPKPSHKASHQHTHTDTPASTKTKPPLSKQRPHSEPVPASQPKKTSFSPTTLPNRRPAKTSRSLVLLPLFATLFASAVALGIFSASSQVVVDATSSDSGVTLRISDFLELLQQ